MGNCGTPIVQVVAEGAVSALVAELSPFQSCATLSVQPQVSAWLSFVPGHIDWHGSADEYVWDKPKVYHGVQYAAFYSATEELPTKALAQSGLPPERILDLTPGTPQSGFLGVIDDALVDRALTSDPTKQVLEPTRFAGLGCLTRQSTPTSMILQDILATAGLM